MLFVCPLKFSPPASETRYLYDFSQLFSRNSSPGRLPLPRQSHFSCSSALKVCTARGPHGGMSGRAAGAAPAGHSSNIENTSFTQKVLTCESSEWLCHIITSSLSFSESGFFLALGSSTAAFFIPFPLSKPWIWSLLKRQYLFKWHFFCPIKHVCSAGTCTE